MYQNLEQRIIHSYMDMFPKFVPWGNAKLPPEAQEQFYTIMKNMYELLYRKPELLFKVFNEDDAYPNRYNRKSYNKPNLLSHMKSDLKKMDAWLNFLFELGKHGVNAGSGYLMDYDFPINKGYQTILKELGFSMEDYLIIHLKYPQVFKVLNWMVNRDDIDAAALSRCMFDPKHNYLEDAYSALFGNEKVFRKLVRYLVNNGYECFERLRSANTLDYVMEHAERATLIGSPLHGDPNHTGISFDYKAEALVPQYMVLRILGLKELLIRFDEMSPDLKDFVWLHCKHCDNCGYCTQTNKSGKRQAACIKTTCRQGTARLCTLYPGFYSTFEQLDEKLYDNITEYLAFMDGKREA
jgi:hypothetical protein